MEQVLRAWSYLSGHKTEISGALFGAAQIVKSIGYVGESETIERIAAYILTIGLTHKAVKAIKK
ncbi:hypothetical protein KAR91_78565 [Candidatus Pacearchaeota archaeon]|nr:hypothetical protein [Candidatus Pacearchaeota archaeon]